MSDAGENGRALVEFDVPIPMRDGSVLRADVVRPASGEPVPVILLRSPYPPIVARSHLDHLRAVHSGFVVVSQSVRGTGPSDGDFVPWEHEPDDGHDTVEWCARQPWSSGAVAGFGASYLAHAQFFCAQTRPASLRAMVPMVAPSHPYDVTYEGGALLLGSSLGWAISRAGERIGRMPAGSERADALRAWREASADMDALLRTTPLREIPILARHFPAWGDWLDHPGRDEWWGRVSLADRPDLPMFMVSGWWDIFLRGSLAEWARGSQHPASRLVIGPWSHLLDGESHGDVHYGADASAAAQDITGTALAFLRSVLDGAPATDGDRVRYFVMGSNEWRSSRTWPPATQPLHLWFHPARRLASEAPPTTNPSLDFVHDPLDPVPTLGGRNLLQGSPGSFLTGPAEQSRLDHREDILRFTSDPVDHPLTIAGDVVVTLHAATTGADADWAAKLVDLYPDGRSYNVADGFVRARYRDGASREALVEPGDITRLEILLGPTAYSFLPGHRMRVDVAGSNFPRFDVNPGSGMLAADAPRSAYRPTHQRVFIDAGRPSGVSLPVLER